jgi:hypothetical protein
MSIEMQAQAEVFEQQMALSSSSGAWAETPLKGMLIERSVKVAHFHLLASRGESVRSRSTR